jgi:hypothetical protein
VLYNSNLAARTSLSFRIRPPGWKIYISIVSILGSEAAANRKVCLNYRARAKVGIIFKPTTTSRKIKNGNPERLPKLLMMSVL